MGDFDITLSTLKILAWSKVILFTYLTLGLYFIYKKKPAIWHVVLSAIALISFYIVLAWPLQNMWWGNVGDEVFVSSYLGQTLLANPWNDFYYTGLPNFYPPLFFWLTGLIARPMASNAIVAYKVGLTGTILIWFVGIYVWQKYFWQKVVSNKNKTTSIVESSWFWFLVPLVYFAMLDFDTVLLKPYENLAALGGVLLVGFVSRSLHFKKWDYKLYLFLGISGGLLFLSFYFWWIIFVPTLFILALLTKHKAFNVKRIVNFGLIVFAVSLVFIGPLLWSYLTHGVENNQAIHFVAGDLATFMPWSVFSLRGLVYLFGLAGLIIFYKKSFVKSALFILVLAYVYQFINILVIVAGGRPVQASKHFLFLGTAAIVIGLVYLLIYLYNNKIKQWSDNYKLAILFLGFLLLISRLPFSYFVDDPVVQRQIRLDLERPTKAINLAQDIKQSVPDYQDRVWLSSGSSNLNAYLPLHYYIAPSVHFSHHAAMYSERMAEVEDMSQANSPEEFMSIVDNLKFEAFNSILVYDPNPDSLNYNLYFWHDNFPNGGKDVEVSLPKDLIIEDYWQEVYNKNNWKIFLRKN